MGIIPFTFDNDEWRQKFNFIPVDQWFPMPFNPNTPDIFNQDTVLTSNKGSIIAPISMFYKVPDCGVGNNSLDFFITSTKKCYNSVEMRDHTCKYINYFERFYDLDKEYIAVLSNIKYLIDYNNSYSKEAFIYDLKRYILSGSILEKTRLMTEDNYTLSLAYKNTINPSLQYTDEHAKVLMNISVLFNLIIPLLTHFAYSRKITAIDEFLLEIFDRNILTIFNVDIYNKLYETSITNVSKNAKANAPLWGKQDIRGRNVTTHSLSSVKNIILNIIPKYTFDQNIIAFNYASIKNNTGFQITDIEYEFKYIPLSSSKRDEDSNSEFDKFESSLVKQNEALYLQNKFNAFETMNTIDSLFGPFNEEEIDFYEKELNGDNGINSFQKQLVFNIFYKYFGDSVSIKAINKRDYIKLMIVLKKMLLSNYMIMLPYIIAGRVVKVIGRKSVNKKELVKLESSPNYKLVMEKYKNDKIIKHALSIIATIISSEFEIIDFNNKEINGKKIEIVPDIIIEEVLMYILLI